MNDFFSVPSNALICDLRPGRCRKAERCQLHTWTAWAGHVPDGRCVRQTSTQPVTPHYKYEEKPDNCSSVKSDCPQPRNRERISCKLAFFVFTIMGILSFVTVIKCSISCNKACNYILWHTFIYFHMLLKK